MHRIHPTILTRAREMRHPLTRVEAKLWMRLRNRQLGGFKFRRQHVIDRFVVDFCCVECRLAVEIDGPSHSEPEQIQYDIARTECLNEVGYQLLRFWNSDVDEHMDGVLETILAQCQSQISILST